MDLVLGKVFVFLAPEKFQQSAVFFTAPAGF